MEANVFLKADVEQPLAVEESVEAINGIVLKFPFLDVALVALRADRDLPAYPMQLVLRVELANPYLDKGCLIHNEVTVKMGSERDRLVGLWIDLKFDHAVSNQKVYVEHTVGLL